MKIKHLLTLAAITVMSGSSAWADTNKLSTDNGWTKVSDLGSMTLNDFYFAFVDDSRDLMLSLGDGYEESTEPAYRTPVYLPCENAEMNPNMLWTLEKNTANNSERGENCYSIRNAEYNTLCLQTEWNQAWYCRTHDQGNSNVTWCRWTIALADGKYTIQNGNYPQEGYIGPWSDASFTNGMEVAGNKNEANRGYFQIYAIAKSKVDWINKASLQNPANFTYKITNPDFEKRSTLNGWTNSGEVNFGAQSNNSFTGKSGRRYVENYHGDGTLDINQTLKDMPVGTYKLVAQAQTSGSDGVLYANDKETSVTSNDSYEVKLTLSEIGDIKIGFKATSNGSAWTGVDNFRLYYYGDISNLTSSIVNNSFEDGLEGWTNDGSAKVAAQSNTSFEKTGGKYAECWQPNGTVNVHQVVSNLPAGVYKVSARVKARGLSSAKIFANSSAYNLKIEDNEYEYDVYEKLAAEGSIDLGINAVGTGAASSWIAFDNFRLMYCGEDFPQADLETGLLYNKHLEAAQTSAQTTFNANPNGTNYTALVYASIPVKEEKAYEVAQVDRTTAALTSSSIATDVIDGWRCTNTQAFHVNTWSGEGATDGSNMTTPFIENWVAAGGLLGDGEISYLMVGLNPGDKYAFSALGRAIIEKDAEATLKGIKMFANETEIDLTEQGEVKSAGENSLVYGTFTLEGTVNSAGVLAIGFKINDTNCNWLSFKNVKFGELPSDADKSALADAITAADGKVYGFENGEYAPYANAAAIIALNTAKAIDVEHAMKAEIVNATNALTNATWTANDGDVTIVYNGDMAEGMDGNSPKGWNGAGWGRLENAAGEKKVYYYNSNRTVQYGVVEGFTMPLKAATVYQLTYSYGSQANNSCKGLPVSVKLGVTEMESHDFGAFGTVYGTELKTVSMKFTTTDAGDYTLNFGYNGNVGITDVQVVKVAATDIPGTTVAATNGWGTFISPVDREIPDNLKAYTCESIENETTLVLTEASSIKANTAYILENTTNADVTIKPVNAIDPSNSYETHTTGLLTGVYAETAAPNGKYVLQNNDGVVGFYLVDTEAKENPTPSNLKVGANRCYLTKPSAGARVRALYFSKDTVTGINASESDDAIEAIYNANGIEVSALQAGLNIVKMKSGKVQKVLVK